MTNLYWIAYYKSLVVRSLMDRKDAIMFVKTLRTYEREYRLTAKQIDKLLSLGCSSGGKVGFANLAQSGLLQKKLGSE